MWLIIIYKYCKEIFTPKKKLISLATMREASESRAKILSEKMSIICETVSMASLCSCKMLKNLCRLWFLVIILGPFKSKLSILVAIFSNLNSICEQDEKKPNNCGSICAVRKSLETILRRIWIRITKYISLKLDERIYNFIKGKYHHMEIMWAK